MLSVRKISVKIWEEAVEKPNHFQRTLSASKCSVEGVIRTQDNNAHVECTTENFSVTHESL